MFEQQVTLGPGTGTFTQHTFEILIMLLGAFLLGVWLGWMLWNKYKQEADKLRFDVQSMTATLNTLNSEMNGLKTKLAAAESSNRDLNSQVDKLTEDNRIFREQLTETSDDLAETEQRNRKLETELGLSFEPPTATPENLPLEINTPPPEPPADEPTPPTAPPVEEPPVVITIEKPTASEVIVEVTDIPEAPPVETQPAGGGEVIDTPEIPVAEKSAEETKIDVPPPAEKPAEPVVTPPEKPAEETEPAAVAAAGDEKDDLTVIEGIGPKIQELLRQYGILTYKQLAETEVTRLKEILAAAGPQLAMHDPGTWSAQANLAANDKWEDLKAYQGFLKGGKTPTNPPG